MQFADDQAASRIDLEDGTSLTKCDQCRSMYSARTPPGIPPCENCKVEPMEENTDAFHIYLTTRGQYIMGMNGPVGINHLAIYEAMRLYRIKNRVECFEKVIKLHGWWLEENRKKE